MDNWRRQQMTEVTSAVKDLHSSNTLLLNRFKDIVIDGRHSDCKEGTDRVQAEVTDLKRRFSMLEDGRNLHAETIKTLTDQLTEVKERVNTLNETLPIDGVVNKPELEPKQIAGTRTTNVGDFKRLQGSSDIGTSGNGREEASCNTEPTKKHDREIDIHPQEAADGNTCDEIVTTRTRKDWKDTSRTYSRRVIVEIRDSNTAVVQWENGDRNTYMFNGRDDQEIEGLTSGFEPFNSDGHVLGYPTSTP